MTSWNLLHINTERDWRGGEYQTLLLAQGLRARGHRCWLAAPGGSPLEGRALEMGLEVLSFSCRGEFDLKAIRRLAHLLDAHSPRLLHYHTSHAITLGSLASLWAGRRLAVASRRVSFPLSRNPLARLKYTWRVDRVIAVSEAIRDALLSAGVPGERVAVIPSAVDLERLRATADRPAGRRDLGIGEGEFLVGALGHLAPHKGHAVLVEAARRVVAREPKFRFVLTGKGEEEADLRRQIEAAGLSSVFRLTGFRKEVAAILSALDVLAFPSLSGEGSPAVLKEAMACGVAVVASDISGVGEIIQTGREGLLVPSGDPEALAEALLRLARDRELRVECARRGRERSLDFSVTSLVDRTEALYQDLMEAGRR
ncbi:MAG TPA: glycosyltransferase [Candidatus Polarisedimenticolia bacterium]|nr:glycosyltransferase [Candidatus Polarisedimenticolia bacterium]